jgi:hypothetical protein
MQRRQFLESAALMTAPSTNQAQRRAELYSLLGDLPPRDRAVAARTIATEQRDGFTLEKLILDLNGFEPVPAYFLKVAEPGKRPTVLFNHWHGGQYKLGKDQVLEARPDWGNPSWGDTLTKSGHNVLAIDTWVFGERATRTEADVFKEMLWKGQVMWGMMVYDSLKAIDYLVTRPDVDASRLATIGMSMGSTMAFWTAALDTRLKVCIDICCQTDFQALIESNNLKGHGIYYYVPSLLKHFTTSQINELIIPRAHSALAGNLDGLTPPTGLDRINREVAAAYAAAGVPQNWKMLRYDVAHVETPAMRAQAISFLELHLNG